MYCQKCNLHSEEYVDKCPLCDGPMEVDEVASGVMKTPTIPDRVDRTEDLAGEESFLVAERKDEEGPDLDATVTLEVDRAQIIAEVEPERVQPEESEGAEEVPYAPSPSQDEPFFEQKEPAYEEEALAPAEISGRKRPPLFLSGGILLIVILAVLGYFLFSSPEKVSKPDKVEVAVAKKMVKRQQPATPRKKIAARKQKAKKAETKSKELEKTAALVLPEKVEPPVSPKTEESAAPQEAVSAKPLPDKKAPPVPETIAAIPPTKPAVTAPTLAPVTPTTPQPVVAAAEPEKKLAKAPEAFPASLPSPNENGPYSIHVGSFRSQGNAFLLRDQLQNKGYPVLCRFLTIPGKGDWYRAQVGYYSSLEDARRIASKLEKEEKLSTLILTRK